jgi:hypothetical protein
MSLSDAFGVGSMEALAAFQTHGIVFCWRHLLVPYNRVALAEARFYIKFSILTNFILLFCATLTPLARDILDSIYMTRADSRLQKTRRYGNEARLANPLAPINWAGASRAALAGATYRSAFAGQPRPSGRKTSLPAELT